VELQGLEPGLEPPEVLVDAAMDPVGARTDDPRMVVDREGEVGLVSEPGAFEDDLRRELGAGLPAGMPSG
jgi:hypothetical protein